jgi:alginate O-acetyltransferase complex protein AlgI
MLLGGLWHGANWTFVLWGAYHGGALLLYNGGRLRASWLPKWSAIGLTFLFVVIGWVIFRAATVHDALLVYRAMLGLNGIGLGAVRGLALPITLLIVALIVSMRIDTYEIPRPKGIWYASVQGAALTVCLLRLYTPSPFLYFQF